MIIIITTTNWMIIITVVSISLLRHHHRHHDNNHRQFHPPQVYQLRFGELPRVPDAVVWPGSHAEVEAVVALANQHNVVIIPYGGGTSVSGALQVNPSYSYFRGSGFISWPIGFVSLLSVESA